MLFTVKPTYNVFGCSVAFHKNSDPKGSEDHTSRTPTNRPQGLRLETRQVRRQFTLTTEPLVGIHRTSRVFVVHRLVHDGPLVYTEWTYCPLLTHWFTQHRDSKSSLISCGDREICVNRKTRHLGLRDTSSETRKYVTVTSKIEKCRLVLPGSLRCRQGTTSAVRSLVRRTTLTE